MKRICVVGTTGTGKTTLGRRLAALLECPHLELDSFYWGPDWTPRDTVRFRADVAAGVEAERWVADGNYQAVRDLVWGKADTLVWLDYSIGTVLLRLIKRTVRRVVTREELWNGNRERGWVHLTRKSLFLWALQTHWRRRRTYRELLIGKAFPHLEVRRVHSPREAKEWLAEIADRSRLQLLDRDT